VVNVIIHLDATSHIVGTPTVQSSPSQLLNAAAIKAAQESTFRTEIKNCEPVEATYIFAVEFNNN
jgi:outer membrane biosynthesis protein TonB